MNAAAPTATPSPASTRLMSLDALRGFDMFWIIGADGLVRGLRAMNENWFTTGLATQLEHVEWEGFRFYDLIFPLFVFMVGVSLVFSLTRTIAEHGRSEALKRVFRRGLLLFCCCSSSVCSIRADSKAAGRTCG
jgi:predicted acyltransferase